jgi:hypothetical protein
MILIGLAIILVIMFCINTRTFPYMLVSYYVFYDMFDGFYKDDKIYAVLRYVVPLCLIIIYVTKYRALRNLDSIFVVLLSYIITLWIFNPGDPITTSRNVLPLIITLMMIPIGKQFGRSENLILNFEKYNRVLLVALPLYIIYANLAGISGFYSDAFSTGYLITSRMYIVPIVVFLAIHYSLTNKNKGWLFKIIDIGFILLNICILLINTRRTTFAMLAVAIIVYTMFNKRLFFKMLFLVGVLFAAMVVSYPLYADRLNAQLEKRERIQEVDTYEDEGRVLETIYLIEYHKKKNDIGEILFGIQLFDTYDFGTRYFGRDRPIHSDINMLFFSTGIVGLILFYLFFQHYFFKRRRSITTENKKLYYPLLLIFVIVLLPGRFIGTLTFAPLLMLLMSALKYGNAEQEVPSVQEAQLAFG